MIVIRGIRGEQYAKEIERGLVGCRDILSALYSPPKTGYAFSDYFEKNFVQAASQIIGKNKSEFRMPDYLFSVLTNSYIPYMYMTYFHILNEHSEEWLDKSFKDSKDTFFIALNIETDRITNTSIGKDYIGSRIEYLDNIQSKDQDALDYFQPAVTVAIEDNSLNKLDLYDAFRVFTTLTYPLLVRERDEKYNEIENEFRIIAYDCPKYINGVRHQKHRSISIITDKGTIYEGMLIPEIDYLLKNNNPLLINPFISLSDLLTNENGHISISSCFKSIDIRKIASSYKFVGNIDDCRKLIADQLSKSSKDILVDKTVCRTYSIEELDDSITLPGKQKIDYGK